MTILFLYLFFIPISIVIGLQFDKNLSIEQWRLMKTILKHPKTTFKMRSTVTKIIYSKYESWALHKAYKFKKFHKHKCRNININDLILYSLEGLKKATIKYNGNSPFYMYADIYISGQLYKGLTELQPITNIPKSIRVNKNNDIKTEYNYHYKKRLNTLFVGYRDYWMFEKRQDISNDLNAVTNNFSYYEIWNNINNMLDLFSKKVFQYKYDYYFNKINSNKRIAELMSCSEETIRLNLKRSTIFLENICKNNIM